jgi:hypothetical protein
VAPAVRELRVPRSREPLVLDGEVEEHDWLAAARTGPFVGSDNAPGRPYSDARLLWRDHQLYVAL